MPELPEVETIARTLRARLIGRRIVEARFSSRLVLRADPATVARQLRGRTILGVERRGKFLLLRLDGGALTIHLGMTGKLLWNGTPGPHTRAEFTLDQGALVYDDIRQFGRIEPGEAARLARLGPDPLAITEAEFAKMLRGRSGQIKPLLLNQGFLCGLGNIYVDEALHRARLHPRKPAGRVRNAGALYRAIREVLEAAIESGGSSVSDYVDGEGRAGAFQLQHRVYGKEGEPCPVCGTPIRRIVLGGRGTHYCPQCQRL